MNKNYMIITAMHAFELFDIHSFKKMARLPLENIGHDSIYACNNKMLCCIGKDNFLNVWYLIDPINIYEN
jgi:hypothetical protein